MNKIEIRKAELKELEDILIEAAAPKIPYDLINYFNDESGNFEKELQFNAIIKSQELIREAIKIINKHK